MPQLRWNKYDFIEWLQVDPETDPYEESFIYTIPRNGLVLSLTVRPSESVIDVALRREQRSENILKFSLVVRGHVEYKREKRMDFLWAHNCRIVEDQFYYWYEKEHREYEKLYSIEIAVDPDISIRLYGKSDYPMPGMR